MATFVEIIEQADALYASAFNGVPPWPLSDVDSLALLAAVERHGRLVDASRIRVAADVAQRSNRFLGRDSLAWKMGCRTGQDLISRVTLTSGREANRRVRLGEVTSPRVSVGTVLPPLFPAVAAGLASGALGMDAAEAITGALRDMESRVAPDQLLMVERALVATATGEVSEDTAGIPGEGLAHPADLIRGQARQWQARLDPDGTAPNEEVYEARSNIGFGELRKGLYPLRGGVTPELRGVIDGVFNTHLSARSATPPSFPSEKQQAEEQARIDAGEVIPGAEMDLDDRTGGQKCADVLRMVFDSAARDPKTPTMGGAAPVVAVHVNAVDLLDGHGVGWIDGVDAPISLRSVRQLICNGGMQKIIFGENGDVLHLGGKERCFTARQRAAMAARDGGSCLLCDVPAAWTEAHHVIPWVNGGKTEIDNGVLLCWHHHHTIETSGWEIRMVRGKPQVKAPPWMDPSGAWRPTAKHPATMGSVPSRN
jgi:hypothetical protein